MCMVRSILLTYTYGHKQTQPKKRMMKMESFAHNAQTRAAIAQARGEVATYFWRGLASVFRR